jgi:hypothetical protein
MQTSLSLLQLPLLLGDMQLLYASSSTRMKLL